MRVAVKGPTVERKPLKFSSSSVIPMKIVLPAIVSLEVSLPLKTKVPISQQQVPSGSSTSPEKLTRLLVVSDHAADTGNAAGLLFGPASSSRKEPAPLASASNIRFFSPIPERL